MTHRVQLAKQLTRLCIFNAGIF